MSAVLALVGSGCSKKKDDADKNKKATPSKPAKPTAVKPPAKPAGPDAKALQALAKNGFGALPARADKDGKAPSKELIDLGRMLYFDARLSKNHDISCNSCHSLNDYGIDVRSPAGQRQTSVGHKGQKGDRNSPTVYNAALHFAQFWDAREPDVEAQAKGPVTNPIEMALPDDKAAVAVLKSIPGYADAFKAAFPEAKDAITFDNMAIAIGAFERGLLTPGRFDQFVGGKIDALDAQELRGFDTFVKSGCPSCHTGPGLGGSMLQKLGLIKPYETKDEGRFKVTNKEADKYFFKVPSLRNIARTGPYMHDGSIASLEEMVAIMSEHQVATGKLSDIDIKNVVAFLNSLTGELPKDYIAEPKLPESGPKTPKADPS